MLRGATHAPRGHRLDVDSSPGAVARGSMGGYGEHEAQQPNRLEPRPGTPQCENSHRRSSLSGRTMTVPVVGFQPSWTSRTLPPDRASRRSPVVR